MASEPTPKTPGVYRPLLSVRGLSTDFVGGGNAAHALEDVSFDVHPGQTLGLVGESGCGKTTTLMSIMRLLPSSGRITSGELRFKERDGRITDLLSLSESEMRRYRWREMAIIFQGAMNALNPVVRVGDQIREPICHHEGLDQKQVDARVDRLLDLVGIAKSRQDQYPHQYSGGMRQRAMIAMALACEPGLLFADEPTTALDVMIQAQVLELLKSIQQELGLAIVLVTHDLGVVAEVCDSVVVMYGGKVAEYGPIDAVYNNPQHPYTQLLLQAFPDCSAALGTTDGPKKALVSIPGSPPRLEALPPGCRFEPRCPYSMQVCQERDPALRRIALEINFGAESVQQIRQGLFDPPHLAACHRIEGD